MVLGSVLLRRSSLAGYVGAFVATLCTAAEVPPTWFEQPPTRVQIEDVQRQVGVEGWAAVTTPLYAGALRAYERDKAETAAAWLNVAKWAQLLGRPEGDFVAAWERDRRNARVSASRAKGEAPAPTAPLSRRISAPLGGWLLRDTRFSTVFFDQLSPLDDLRQVLDVLDRLYSADPKRFESYASLALAIAWVYDVPPPPDWPHAQVTPAALPRRLPDAQVAFAFFVDADRAGRTLLRLGKLDASELKFLVDLCAPFPELAWAQRSLRFPLAELPESYAAVRYRRDRVQNNVMVWPGDTYALPRIYEEGGICVDQAYFATQSAKARGVPSIYFRGAGLDGRHAWFGYLNGARKWELDAGRYAEQRFVTGVAHDPQTWTNLSDHEIAFLSEGFRTLPAYAQARTHASFAELYLALGRPAQALAAARKALNFERRHLGGWQALLAAQNALGADAKTREAHLREAALAFQRYPDLNALFVRGLATSLRARGEVSAAHHEERMIARKNQAVRTDLAVSQAAALVDRAVATQPLAEQIRVFNVAVDQFAYRAGIDFLDQVVRPFAQHLHAQGQKIEARRAIERARARLSVDAGSQLDAELQTLAASVR